MALLFSPDKRQTCSNLYNRIDSVFSLCWPWEKFGTSLAAGWKTLTFRVDHKMKINKQHSKDNQTRLLIKACKGDMRAFEKLYMALFPAVHNYLFKLDSSIDYHRRQDLVQEVFFRTWSNLARFRGDASAKTYFLSIARNVLREEQLYRKKHPVTCVGDVSFYADTITAHASTHETIPKHNEDFRRIKRAMAKLSTSQRQAIYLIDIQNFTKIQAARLAGCSYDQFANRHHRARKRLKKLMAVRD